MSEKQILTEHLMLSEWKSHNVRDLTLEVWERRMVRVQLKMIAFYYENMSMLRKKRADATIKILKTKLEEYYE